MSELLPRGASYLRKRGPIRDAIARAASFVDGDGIMSFNNDVAYSNYAALAEQGAMGDLPKATEAILDKTYPTQDVSWRDVMPLAASDLFYDPQLVVTSYQSMGFVLKSGIARGGTYDINFRNRLVNTQVEGKFTGVIVDSIGKLGKKKPRLSPQQQAAGIDALLHAYGDLHRQRNDGTYTDLFTRDEVEAAVKWIRPGREHIVFRGR